MAGGQVKVPARPILLALQPGATDLAPSLILLVPKPGGTFTVDYKSAPGWSLVVRCIDRETKKPVPRADLTLLGTTVAGESSPVAHADSADDGLAVFGGISLPFVSVSGKVGGLLDANVPGVGGPRGKMEVRDVAFDHGGRLNAAVTIDGAPAVGTACQIVSMRANAKKGKGLVPDSQVIVAGRVNGEGSCLLSGIREGTYLFRVIPQDGGAGSDDVVGILEGMETAEQLELNRITVSGKVRQGDNLLAGATVIAALEADLPNGSGRTSFPVPMIAKTNADGEYTGSVWLAGRYSFEVLPTTATVSAADRSVFVGSDGASVDFDLKGEAIKGLVVDQAGAPVDGAWVTLIQTVDNTTNNRRNTTDSSGQFEYSFDGKGTVELKAGKLGYKTCEPVAVPSDDADEIPATTLTITKLSTVKGRVLTTGGAPVSNASIASFTTGVPIRQGLTVSDGDGKFEVPRSLKGATRIFSTGPGCALQATDVSESAEEAQLLCTNEFAGLKLKLKSAPPDSEALQDEFVWLRWNGTVIPRDVLMNHFSAYGLPWTTGGDGALSIVGIPPGEYDLYLGQAASEYTIVQGEAYGYVGTFHADANSMADLEFEVKVGPTP